MGKIYTALGLMSGTSMDGVDASFIRSDNGKNYMGGAINQYFEYDLDLYRKLTNLRDKITNQKDLNKYSHEIKSVEKEITLFHAKIANVMIKENPEMKLDIIGFHGQTIFHKANEKLSVQLGDGKLLSQLTRTTVVYDFRQEDLKNGGQGAPLTPIYHQLISRQEYGVQWPILILNIGGISNVTSTKKSTRNFEPEQSESKPEFKMFAADIGPGNCLIDEWIRKNSKYKYDKDGLIAKSGKVNELIFNQAIDNFLKLDEDKLESLDIKDFDISFVRGLSLEDGAATLTHLTARLIGEGLIHFMLKNYAPRLDTLSNAICLVCGGGRKNKYLIDILKNNLNIKELILIDDHGIKGDFIESQAFGYLAIRSFLGLPISFPETTGCINPCTGGVIVKNY
jgi:anhydro-N-acetylmuramic acid kinase